jgi:hypothetical protein
MDKLITIVLWVALGFVAYEVLKNYFPGTGDLPALPVTLGTNNQVPAQTSVPSFGQALNGGVSIADVITPGSGYQGATNVTVTAPTYTGYGGAL